MDEFKKVVSMINELDKRRQIMIDNYCDSWDELSEVLRKLLIAKISGYMHCNLCKDICPDLYAKELKEIGFNIKEVEDGYVVYFDKEN